MNLHLQKFIEFICVKKIEEFENLNENITKDTRVPKKQRKKKKKHDDVAWLYFY